MSMIGAMSTLVALYSVALSPYALMPLIENKSAVRLAIERAVLLPSCEKVLILATKKDEEQIQNEIQNISLTHPLEVQLIEMTAFNILECCSKEREAFSDVFLLPLEAPFVDVEATFSLYERHAKYKAEYTFAEGYPEFLFPQVLNMGLCNILSSFVKNEKAIVKRDFVFDIVKKDINSYDIETFIAPEDVRILKLKFIVDTKRDLMLCKALEGINAKNYVEKLKKDALKLKTLPRYYMIEINPNLPFSPIYKPCEAVAKEPMSLKDFSQIIQKISQFSSDAIISLSIYGDPLESEYFVDMAKIVLKEKNLSLLIETHGVAEGAKEKIEAIQKIVKEESVRAMSTPPLYWITFIDATTAKTYAKVYNIGEDEATTLLKKAYETAEFATALFGENAFVQIVRMNENEDELEGFYRNWKERGTQVIIQKYDHYCSHLPDRRVADLSPLKRMPCRHLSRDVCISCNGDVLLCKEDVMKNHIMGNVLCEDLGDIWARFDDVLKEHLKLKFGGLCELCDEYYTYNF